MLEKSPRKFIDFHVHVFPDDVAPRAVERFINVYSFAPKSDGTVSGTMAYMDEAGIDIIVPQPVATKPSQVRGINDWALSIRSDRIVPFGSMHPEYEDIAGEIDWLCDHGFRGIKLQPNWQEFYPNDERAFPIYEAAQGRMAILFHTGRETENVNIWGTADRLLAVQQKFPDLTVIAAHMGGYQCWVEVEKNLIGTDIYLDSSYCPEDELPDGELTRLMRKHGTSKILFGSDFPFGDTKRDVSRLKRMELTQDEREDIAWRNAARILSLPLD